MSLFTKVPVQLALSVANRRLSSDNTLSSRTNLSVSELLLCWSSASMQPTCVSEVTSLNRYMGLQPVSVTVVNLVMEDVERRALTFYDIHLRFWKRYVDDVCTVVPTDRVQHLLQHLNGIESSIRFTVEVETDGSLPFLDVGIFRCSDGCIVHRKPTHTDKYLDFTSHHPLAHKRAVVQTLTSRASTLSSDSHSKAKVMNRIMSYLKLNSYPKAFIFNT